MNEEIYAKIDEISDVEALKELLKGAVFVLSLTDYPVSSIESLTFPRPVELSDDDLDKVKNWVKNDKE